jgi:hypothetical protein
MRIPDETGRLALLKFSGFQLTRIVASAIPLLMFFFICSGCARHNNIKPPTIPLSENPQGMASFKILTNAPGRQTTDSSTFLEIVPPMPVGELKPPDYPSSALKARFGNVRIVARVQLDDAGEVVGITESPIEMPRQGCFIQEFRTEVEKAIRQWNFLPAKSQECMQGNDLNDDGKPDYVVVISTQPIPVYFDVQFEFGIVDGVGRAQSK